ncbi:MAG: hypothetical protein QW343_03850 [Candidatus Norongarragalinales archaeon]
MVSRSSCPNRAINESDCPCQEKSCPRHGVCCECIRYHKRSKEYPRPACFR